MSNCRFAHGGHPAPPFADAVTVATSHSSVVVSVPTVASTFPSGLNATALRGPWCAATLPSTLPPGTSHKVALPSSSTCASVRPSEANASALLYSGGTTNEPPLVRPKADDSHKLLR